MLTLFGIIAIVIFTIQVYKTANGNGRSGSSWAFANVAAGIVLQFIFPIMVGILIVLFYLVTGSSLESINDTFWLAAWGIDLVGLALSIAGMFFVLRHVANIPGEMPETVTAPPPPPSF